MYLIVGSRSASAGQSCSFRSERTNVHGLIMDGFYRDMQDQKLPESEIFSMKIFLWAYVLGSNIVCKSGKLAYLPEYWLWKQVWGLQSASYSQGAPKKSDLLWGSRLDTPPWHCYPHGRWRLSVNSLFPTWLTAWHVVSLQPLHNPIGKLCLIHCKMLDPLTCRWNNFQPELDQAFLFTPMLPH